MGSPASCWATPTVKGLHMPVAKPQPMASRLMPRPTMASQPMLAASAAAMGTSGTHSSNEPTSVPMAIKNSVTMQIS